MLFRSLRGVDPGSDIETKFWAGALKDAAYMPKADAGKVRLAAMSDGKLMAMERANYAHERETMTRLASDVRDMQAARAANAEIIAHRMSKLAVQKQADTKLLAAEENYVSTVSQVGGKSKVSTPASELSNQILKDAQQARALQLVGQAGAMMAARYGSLNRLCARHFTLGPMHLMAAVRPASRRGHSTSIPQRLHSAAHAAVLALEAHRDRKSVV